MQLLSVMAYYYLIFIKIYALIFSKSILNLLMILLVYIKYSMLSMTEQFSNLPTNSLKRLITQYLKEDNYHGLKFILQNSEPSILNEVLKHIDTQQDNSIFNKCLKYNPPQINPEDPHILYKKEIKQENIQKCRKQKIYSLSSIQVNREQNIYQDTFIVTDSINKVSQCMYLPQIFILYIGLFDEKIGKQLKHSATEEKHIDVLEYSLIEDIFYQGLDIKSTKKNYIISKYNLDEKQKNELLQSVQAIFFCGIECKDSADDPSRIHYFENQKELIQKGVLELQRHLIYDVVTKKMPNFSTISNDKTKIVFSQLSIFWMLYSPPSPKYLELFYQLIDYRTQQQCSTILLSQYSPQEFLDLLKFKTLEKEYNCISLYTKQGFFYRIINRSLRSLQLPTHIPYIKYPFRLLFEQIKQLHQVQTKLKHFKFPLICYRGCAITQEQLRVLKQSIGKIIHFEGFLSTSLSRQVADTFGNYLVQIQIKNDLDYKNADFQQINGYFADISHQSYQTEEREVIFTPLNYYKVKQMLNSQEKTIIKLEFITPAQLKLKQQLDSEQAQLIKYCSGSLERRKGSWNQGRLFQNLGFHKEHLQFHLANINESLKIMKKHQKIQEKIYEWVQKNHKDKQHKIQRQLHILFEHFKSFNDKTLCKFTLMTLLIYQLINPSNTYYNCKNNLFEGLIMKYLYENKIQIFKELVQNQVSILLQLLADDVISDTQSLCTYKNSINSSISRLKSYINSLQEKFNNITDMINFYHQNDQKEGNYSSKTIWIIQKTSRLFETYALDRKVQEIKECYEFMQARVRKWNNNREFPSYVITIFNCIFGVLKFSEQTEIMEFFCDIIYKQIFRNSLNYFCLEDLPDQICNELGSEKKHLSLYQKAKKIREQYYGRNSPQVSEIQKKIGYIYFYLGYYQKSISILEGLNQLSDISYEYLGASYNKLGKYDKSLEIFTKLACKISKTGDLLSAINKFINQTQHSFQQVFRFVNISTSLCFLGRYQYQALKLNFTILSNIKDEKYPLTKIVLLNNIVSIYLRLNQPEKSLVFCEQALSMAKQFFKKNKKIKGTVYNNLGNIYHKLKLFDQSLQAYQSTIKFFNQFFGQDHPQTFRVLNNIAVVELQRGNVVKSKQLHDKIYEKHKKFYGLQNQLTMISLYNLANCQLEMKLFHQAQPKLEKTAKFFRNRQGCKKAQMLSILNSLLIVQMQLKQFQNLAKIHKEIIGLHLQNFVQRIIHSLRNAENSIHQKAIQAQIHQLQRKDWMTRYLQLLEIVFFYKDIFTIKQTQSLKLPMYLYSLGNTLISNQKSIKALYYLCGYHVSFLRLSQIISKEDKQNFPSIRPLIKEIAKANRTKKVLIFKVMKSVTMQKYWLKKYFMEKQKGIKKIKNKKMQNIIKSKYQRAIEIVNKEQSKGSNQCV